MRVHEEEEYLRKGIYRDYKEKRKVLGKKDAIDKMVKERLNLEERYDDFCCRREYSYLLRIITSEQARLAKEERYYKKLAASLDKDDIRNINRTGGL